MQDGPNSASAALQATAFQHPQDAWRRLWSGIGRETLAGLGSAPSGLWGWGGESLAVDPGAQELDLGISTGIGRSRVGEKVSGVRLWELGSLIRLVLCFEDMCVCRKPAGGRAGHNHVLSL